jgi:hypothetical protein
MYSVARGALVASRTEEADEDAEAEPEAEAAPAED